MLPDGLGSVRRETGPTGNVLAARSFDPFGIPLEGDGGTPFGYAGEQYDASTGLLFLRARYYDPALGRFLSRDPFPGVVMLPVSQHPYVYALNNSLRFTDPTGHCVPGEPGCQKGGGDPLAVQPVQQRPAAKIWLHPFTRNRLENYCQDQQGHPSGCAAFSMAMSLNLLTGGNVSGADIEAFMELTTHKPPGFGQMPSQQGPGLNDLFTRMNPDHPPFVAEFCTGGTQADLIDNLNNGYPTIVSVSWGAGIVDAIGSGVGHALVVVGYDPSTGDFAFLDPNGAQLRETAADFQREYGVDFSQAWQEQPNEFIPAGSMVTIKPKQ